MILQNNQHSTVEFVKTNFISWIIFYCVLLFILVFQKSLGLSSRRFIQAPAVLFCDPLKQEDIIQTWAGMVGADAYISAFLSQGPRIDPGSVDIWIFACVTFFSA